MTQVSKQVVLLVYPFLDEANWKNELRLKENLALGYLSAVLRREGFPVHTINAELLELDAGSLVETVNSSSAQYPLIGVSCTSQRAYPSAKHIVRALRAVRPSAHITVGGIFPSIAHLEVLEDTPELDSVVRGEGEYTLIELVQRITAGQSVGDIKGISYRGAGGEIIVNPSRERIRNLDELPFPSRDELPLILESGQAGEYAARLIASKGCSGRCTFCSIHTFYGDGARIVRSPRNVADEIEQLVRRWSIRRFRFEDDLFVDRTPASREWAYQLCDEILRRQLQIEFSVMVRSRDVSRETFLRLRKAGLNDVCLGVETGVQRMLNRYRKGTTIGDNDRSIAILEGIGGINIRLGYIMFDPDLTLEELRENYLWLRGCPHALIINFYNKLNVYYGTPIAERLSREGRLLKTHFSDRWNYSFKDARVQRVCEIVDQCKLMLTGVTRRMNRLTLIIRQHLNCPSEQVRPIDLQGVLEGFQSEELGIWILIFDNALALCASSVPNESQVASLLADTEQRGAKLAEKLDHTIRALSAP